MTALYMRLATTALASSYAAACATLRKTQSPCASCRGDRACLARKEPPRGWRPRQAFGLVPSRGEVPRQGKNRWRGFARYGEPLQAWRAWSLAKFPDECCGPWQAGPWYPGFHCADSSPRAHDGHAEVVDRGEASRAQKMPAWAATRGARRLRLGPRSPRLQRATRWGPPRPRHLGVKACA